MPKDDELFLDKEEVKRQKEILEQFARDKKLRINDIKKVLSIPEGRRFIWEELKRTKVFAPSYSNNSNQTAFNEGERSIGIAILADVMEARPDAFYQMFTEARSKEQAAKKQEEQDGGTRSS